MASKLRKTIDTGSGAIALSARAPYAGGHLNSVMVHLSAAGAAGDLTITLNSVRGAAYDTVLVTQAMEGLTDYFYNPSNPVALEAGDSIDVAYDNTGGATFGAQIALIDE